MSNELPDVLFDGHAVLKELSPQAARRTSPENVADVLDAVVRILKADALRAALAASTQLAADDLRDAERYRRLRATTKTITSGGRSIAVTPDQMDESVDRQIAAAMKADKEQSNGR